MDQLAIFLQNQIDPEVMRRIFMTIIPIMFVIYVAAVVIVMVPCWFILRKAGFSPWLSLLCILPSLGTLVLLYVLAFAEWRVLPAPMQAYWQPQAPYPPLPQQPPNQPPNPPVPPTPPQG